MKLLLLVVLAILFYSCDKINSPDDNPPLDVTNIKIKSLSSQSIEISWQNTEKEIDRILIYRSINETSFQNIATLNGTDTTFIDNNLDSTATYYYFIVNVSKTGKESLNPKTFSIKYDISIIKRKLQNTNFTLSLTFSNDGRYLASFDSRRLIKIWDIKNNTLEYNFGNENAAYEANIFFSYDEKYIFVALSYGINMYDITTGEYLKTFGLNRIGSTVSPIAPIVAASLMYEMRIYNYLTDELLFTTDENGEMNDIRDIQFSHNGELLAVSYYDKIKIFDTNTWELKYFLPSPYAGEPFNDVYHIRFSPNDAILAAIYGRQKLTFWDVKTQTVIGSHFVQGYDIETIAFHPNNKSLMIGEYYKLIEWNLESMTKENEFWQDVGDFTTLAFSPLGDYLASDGIDNQIYLWGYGWHLLE